MNKVQLIIMRYEVSLSIASIISEENNINIRCTAIDKLKLKTNRI